MPPAQPHALALAAAFALLAAPLHAVVAQEGEERRGPELSGIVFANYQYHVEDGARRSSNEFVLDRAYLTLYAPVGERGSVRLTSDLFRNGREGYDLRLKYGYLQYELHRGSGAFVRAGLLQTVEIEQEEQLWPRWLGQVSTDRFDFFSSADVGVSAGVELPWRMGEMYAVVANGGGYQDVSRDDRFKDYALRLTLTPFAAQEGAGILRGLSVSPWYLKGDTASVFGPGRPAPEVAEGDLGDIGAARRRDRYGVLLGLDDPRLSLGFGLAEYRREEESGANTAAAPVVVADRTSRLATAFMVARPLQLLDEAYRLPLGVVLRYDRFEPDVDVDGHAHFVVGGLTYDVSSHLSLALDYQEQLPRDGAPVADFAPSKVYYLHLQARF
ncbi:MAG TPA: hypothetical protein VGE02_04040 [Gemmatimonadales bacterium]